MIKCYLQWPPHQKGKDNVVKLLKSILVCLFLILGMPSLAAAASFSQPTPPIHYVKQIPTGSADCTSWDDACGLQTALDIAEAGQQIWVAAGTYLPTKLTNTTEPRSATFTLETGVEIYGGFPETGREWIDRNWVDNVTKLSGDIGTVGANGDNSYHVVTGGGVDNTAILDGFTILKGNAVWPYGGGGLFNQNSSLTLRNIIISENNAGSNGGGMYNENSNPTLTNVTFSGNSATYGGGMHNEDSSPTLTLVTFSGNQARFGGGMANQTNSNPILSYVNFIDNTSESVGGGMVNYFSSPVLTNTIFTSNIGESGGGLANLGSHPTLANVTFTGNTARMLGGGVYNQLGSLPTLTNVTITANRATAGGGIYNMGNNTKLTLTNSIVWGNTTNQIYNYVSSLTPLVTYSDVEGAYPGEANINIDPLLGFLADNGGFTKTHALGAGSPAIDAGNPNNCPAIDQRGYYRPINGDGNPSKICDLGAFEYGSTAEGFTLTKAVDGCGSVAGTPEQTSYYFGDTLTLTATTPPGCQFEGWSGDATGAGNPLTVTIYDNTNITANFKQILFKYILFPIYK